MIYIHQEFDTEEEANTFRENMYDSYHPMGYGTHIDVRLDEKSGKWVAHGSRSHSCD